MKTIDDHAETVYKWVLDHPGQKALLFDLYLEMTMEQHKMSTGELALALGILQGRRIIEVTSDEYPLGHRKVWIVD